MCSVVFNLITLAFLHHDCTRRVTTAFLSLTTAGNDVRLSRVNDNTANVIRVCFKRLRLVQSVVVEHSYLHVVRARDDPVLPRNELGGTNRQIAHLERLDQLLIFMVPHVYVAVVKGAQHPRFVGVQIHTLDAVRASCQLTFYV